MTKIDKDAFRQSLGNLPPHHVDALYDIAVSKCEAIRDKQRIAKLKKRVKKLKTELKRVDDIAHDAVATYEIAELQLMEVRDLIEASAVPLKLRGELEKILYKGPMPADKKAPSESKTKCHHRVNCASSQADVGDHHLQGAVCLHCDYIDPVVARTLSAKS